MEFVKKKLHNILTLSALAESLSERNDHDIIPTQNERKNPEGILAKLARLRANLIPTQNERKNPEGILAKLAR